MDEVDPLAVDRRPEVPERVQARLGGPPVVGVAPVRDQFLEVVDGNAVLPAGSLDLIGEAGEGQAVSKIIEHGVVHPDREHLDRLAHHVLIGSLLRGRLLRCRHCVVLLRRPVSGRRAW